MLNKMLIILSSIFINVYASELYYKLELVKTSEWQNSSPFFMPNSTIPGGGTWAGGGPSHSTKYCFKIVNQEGIMTIDYYANDIKPFLNPNSGALNQIKTYANKRIFAIVGAVSFFTFAILSATVGMEETGTETTQPDQYGNLQTTNDKRIMGLGYAFLGLSGLSAITGFYCHFSRGINLRNAIKLHNQSLTKDNTISFGYNFKLNGF